MKFSLIALALTAFVQNNSVSGFVNPAVSSKTFAAPRNAALSMTATISTEKVPEKVSEEVLFVLSLQELELEVLLLRIPYPVSPTLM